MREDFDHSQGESESRQEIDKFIKGFEGVTLTNSEGKKILLKVSHEEIPKRFENDDDTERLSVEFENYKGGEANEGGNYLEFIITPSKKEIYLSYVRLNDPDLQGKGIYSKLMDVMGENFPEGYSLTSVIEHDKTRDKTYDLFAQYEDGEIDEAALKQSLLKSGMLKAIRDKGFNDFKVTLDIIGITVASRKNMDIESQDGDKNRSSR